MIKLQKKCLNDLWMLNTTKHEEHPTIRSQLSENFLKMRTSEHPAMSHKFILKKLEPFQNPVPKRGWFCNDFDVAKANRQMVFRLGFQKAKNNANS